MTEEKSDAERLKSLVGHLQALRDDWDALADKERFGAVDEATRQAEHALEGKIEWEIGVQDDEGNWDFYQSREGSKRRAELDALAQAQRDDDLGDDVEVYQVNGPLEARA